jgi:hypothetical protein
MDAVVPRYKTPTSVISLIRAALKSLPEDLKYLPERIKLIKMLDIAMESERGRRRERKYERRLLAEKIRAEVIAETTPKPDPYAL